MKNLRRSWHCRRLFFRYLRQRDREKQSEKQLTTPPASSKPNPQFDKFNFSISTTIVVTIFLGIISTFIHHYLVIAIFSALLLEIFIAVCGAVWFGKKERKEENRNNLSQLIVEQPSQNTITAQTPLITNDIVLSSQTENMKIDTYAKSEPLIILKPYDMMTGSQFKDLIESYFSKKGYSVKRITPRVNNIDFIVQKGGMVTGVATKKSFDLISRSYVKNVIESAKLYDLKSTIIITTSYYVPEARQLAKESGIMLWDSEILKTKFGGLK